MAYNGLTDLGRTYLAKCLANQKPIIFKKVKVGDGSIPSHKTGQTTTELYSFKKDVEILAKEQQNTAMKLTVLLNNLDLSQGFYVKEMGIYIEDDGVDKLYWYINKDNPSYLYDKNTPSTHRYNVYCEVSSNESVVVNFTGQGLLADKKFVEDSINKAKDSLTDDFNTQLNEKLNKGAVSAEYDDAGKIEAKIKAAQETATNATNATKKIEKKVNALESRPQGDFLEKGGYNGTANDLKNLINGTAPAAHTHNKIQDINNNYDTTFAYSKNGLNFGDFNWLAGWNGYELRAVNKSLFFPISGGTVSGNMTVTGTIGANGITSTGNVTAYSDRKTKANIKEISNSLEKLKTLTAYEYLMIISNQESMGFFADDVEKVFPSAVITDDKGIKQVAYIQLIAPIVNAIKDLDERIKKLEGVL